MGGSILDRTASSPPAGRSRATLLGTGALLFLGGCVAWTPSSWIRSTELPLGFHHQGKKRILIRGETDSYFTKLAVAAVTAEIQSYSGLFEIVETADAAELEMIVSGVLGSGSVARGSGLAFGARGVAIGVSRTTAVEAATTHLGVSVWHREQGQIYENTVTVPKHPNVGMPKAAARIMQDYASGR